MVDVTGEELKDWSHFRIGSLVDLRFHIFDNLLIIFMKSKGIIFLKTISQILFIVFSLYEGFKGVQLIPLLFNPTINFK